MSRITISLPRIVFPFQSAGFFSSGPGRHINVYTVYLRLRSLTKRVFINYRLFKMEKHIDLQAFDGDILRNRGKDSISEVKGQEFDRDRYELARVGKEQVLKVRIHRPWCAHS